MIRVSKCHRCEKRQKECNGPCACTIDGLDIIEHAKQGYCPLGKFSGEPIKPDPILPVPRDEWPAWVNFVAKLATEGDGGVGDTIHRQLGIVGEAFKETLTALGVPCGCDKRRAEWNAKFPYRK